MKVGDLVKLKRPTTKSFNKVFLVTASRPSKNFIVTEWRINWVRVLGRDGWQHVSDFEVVSESR